MEVSVRSSSLAYVARPVVVFAALAVAFPSAGQAQAQAQAQMQAQSQAAAPMGRDDIIAFAKVHVAIGQARDSTQARLAQPRNNSADAQQQLREQLGAKIEEILHHGGMTHEEFRRKTFVVSTDDGARTTFDEVVAQLTGIPTPGRLQAAAPAMKVPAGAVGTHIGHVVNAFGDTPNGQALLPTAMIEARTAAQHAGLAARTPTNLDAMKLHASHVINAVDPSVVATGPGLGYGVKKAALGVATHIELAAKAAGASPNVIMHATHVATSARNTVQRADQVVALAQKIQAAESAADAAALVSQLVSLTQQLIAGADANGDGRITWEQGEGGLQQAQEHVILMVAGEHLPPQ
jgi:hypothetical protein